MLPNSNNFICGTQKNQDLKPISNLIQLDLVPFSFKQVAPSQFLYIDIKDSMTTNIMQVSFTKEGATTFQELQQFMGIYEYNNFGQDNALLVNKEGDVIYYDLINKNSYFMERQHPSPFSSLQIHNIGQHFVTCGGNVKSNTNSDEKIIKLWSLEYNQLVSKARIVTHHTMAIENSLVLGGNRIVTLSNDRSVRVVNLTNYQLQQVIKTSKDYCSGCQFDWNTVLVGGHSKSLDVLDVRSKKIVCQKNMDIPVIQICQMVKINAFQVLFANVNHLYTLDLRNFQVRLRGTYDGERVSAIKALNQDQIVLGNRDKTMQLWAFQ